MTQPEAGSSLAKTMNNLRIAGVDLSNADKRKITTDNERATRATAMGSFWKDAREKWGPKDHYEFADKMGMSFSRLNMIEHGGIAEERDALWPGPTPLSIAIALGKPELYLRFCEEFNVVPYVEPDDHIPEEETGNKQTEDSGYPYDYEYVRKRRAKEHPMSV